jgi:HPt (histidine-containing phosphotransfer) domain-containing protein
METGPHRNVLVADATAVGRQLASFLIGKRGHAVHTVATAADLFARIEPATDLILVHFPLPDADPATVAREVRRRSPNATLIALANQPAEGFDETLPPPFDPAMLDALFQSLQQRLCVNVPRLMKLMDGNRDLLRKLVEVLEPTVASGLAGMKAAIAADDAPSLAALAHRLKGTFGNVAADEAVAAARTLEQMGKSGDLSGAADEMAKLEAAAGRARAELRAMVAG